MADDDNYTSYKFSLERLGALLLVLGALVYCIGIYRQGTLDPLIVVPDMARQVFGIFQYQFLQIQKSFAGANWLGLRPDVASFLILAGPMLGALLLEVLWMARRERSFKNGWRHTSLARMLAFKDPSVRTDVYMLAYQVLALDRLVVALLGLLGPFIIYGLLVNSFPGISLSHYVELHPAAGFIVYVLVADFMGYWYHRSAHHFRALWELHKFHHSATSMNMITAHRNHPFEGAMRMPIKAVAVIVVGPGLDHYLIYNALITFMIMLLHSNFHWKWGWLDRVIVTPQFHRLHHSSLIEHHDSNYGIVFSFWDTWFGTRTSAQTERIEFGVTGNYMNQRGLMHDLVQPFRLFWIKLLARLDMGEPESEPDGAREPVSS